MCSSPPLGTSRSMVVEDASILSPVQTERTMASDSPARSLDEIDLSALRVNVSLGVRVHMLPVSMCARALEAVEHLCPPPVSFFFPLYRTKTRLRAPSCGCAGRACARARMYGSLACMSVSVCVWAVLVHRGQ